MDIVDEKLNPTGQVFSVLGHIANNPIELLGATIHLSSDDFVSTFHQVIFNAINNIAIDSKSQISDITPLAVDVYLKPFAKYYSIWQSNDGVQFLTDAKESQGQFSFHHDYTLLKKFSTLRKYYNQGIDIRDIFDYETSDLNKINKFNEDIEKMEVSDIVEHYTNKVINIRDEINEDDDSIVKFNADDDIDTLLTRLNEEPVMGYPFINGYYNTLFRGMQGGRFMLRSAASGGSKTRSAIRDMANASFSERYEMGKGWIKSNQATVPTLFISTELNKNELQTILLAYVSGLTTSSIESGNYTPFEKKRLQHAVEVIKESEMYFVYVEDFSAVDIQMIIEEYVVRHNIKFAVFDYIQNSPKLTKTFQESYNNRGLREDEILVELSRSLKNMSEKYNIFIMSSTQLNSMADDDNIRVSRTGRALRGGSATINKADYGIIMAKPTAADMKKLQNILKEGGIGADPNFAHFIFKNRSGRSDIILWTSYDMGNMRETPLFITDFNYNLVSDVNPSFIKEKNVDSKTKEEEIKF